MNGKFASLILAVSLAVGFHLFACASPLLLELDPSDQKLGKKELASLSQLFDELENSWTQQPVDSLNHLLDTGRGHKFWYALHCDSLRYGDYLRAVMADSTSYTEFQNLTWRNLQSRVHGLLGFNSKRASLFRCKSGSNHLVGLGKFASMMDLENMEIHPDHPFLGKILVLSLLTPLSWDDPVFDPWRAREGEVGNLPWQDFKPGASGDMVLYQGERGEDEINAHLDSIFKSDPRLDDLGWLKKHLFRKVIKIALLEMSDMQGAWDEYEMQKRGEPTSGAPACPLLGRAVIRLIFLPENSFSSHWHLVLCLPSSLQDLSPFSLRTEPGFADWYERYKEWSKENN